MTLEGKVALVTGAGSGFGRGIAQTFAEKGAQVSVLDLNASAAQETAAIIGDNAMAVCADITDRAAIAGAVAATIEWAGQLNCVVNNAGLGLRPTPLEETTETDFDRLLAVNMKSIFLMSQVITPIFKEQGGGVVLNMASTAGVSPRPNLTWYNASKGWVITATRSMAVELAAHNIRVNALNPVAGDTPMLATFLGDDTPENRQKFIDTIPLGRLSTPQDLGQAAAFLCSDEASLITGVALEVDGGRCI
ncbi:MAG: glucose 1-dehydrogenase [Pseudomonadales bacterium]|nr:glucose 1-dehydrogenase [Pseudomonadales bacterium]